MADYQVLFSGEVAEGANPDTVRQNLARELDIDERKAKALFVGRTVVLKSQLTLSQAEALQSILADLGAVCRIKDYSVKNANPARYKLDEQQSDHTLRDLTAAHIECPRCGHMQLDASHCTRCGVDMEAAIKQKRKEDAIIEKRIRELRAGGTSQAPVTEEPMAGYEPVESAQDSKLGKLGGWFRRRG